MLSYYKVTLSYTDPGPRRTNGKVGVVARDVEEAIALAKSTIEGGDVRIYSINHHGRVDVITQAAKEK
jgi:hypothetical protein